MDNIEVFRLSAEACGVPNPRICVGKCVFDGFVDIDGLATWNPFTDTEQRWQCVEKLMEMGWFERFVNYDKEQAGHFMPFNGANFHLRCPASEFPARALATLQEKK